MAINTELGRLVASVVPFSLLLLLLLLLLLCFVSDYRRRRRCLPWRQAPRAPLHRFDAGVYSRWPRNDAATGSASSRFVCCRTLSRRNGIDILEGLLGGVDIGHGCRRCAQHPRPSITDDATEKQR